MVAHQEQGVLDDLGDGDRLLLSSFGPGEIQKPIHDPLAAA
jgi:hypothetical protein